MQIASIPGRFGIPWAAAAGGAFIRTIPQASQIGVTPGAASLTDGFPPLNFTQIAAGGVPSFGQDFNGILKQVTLWNQWQAAGAPVQWDSTFSASIGGYPFGAILLATSQTHWWVSTVDNNATNPDAAGAGWLDFRLMTAGGGANVGSFKRSTITVDTYGRVTAASAGQQPTYQRFTSGSGTYTPSAGAVRARVRMMGGGGAGNGGGNGGTSTLGGWTARGGSQGGAFNVSNSGGAGGTGGANGTGVLISRQTGGDGGIGLVFSSNGIGSVTYSATGGTGRFGQGPNSGAGGVTLETHAYSNSGITFGGGGGAGEYVEFSIISPVALSYTVGAGAGFGVAGVIEIEEFYD